MLAGQATTRNTNCSLIAMGTTRDRTAVSLTQHQFVVPRHAAVQHLLNALRAKVVGRDVHDTYFLHINGRVALAPGQDLGELYMRYRQDDGILYVTITRQAAFG